MTTIGGINLGNLPQFLFFFADGSVDANWQGATKGFVGDVAVDGIQAAERTSGSVPYAGTIFTNDNTLGAWQNIINQNIGQATGVTNQVGLIAGLEADLVNAIQQINLLPPTPGFANRSSTSLNGLNTQNGINEVFVINVTSGLNFSSQINITGDPGDVYILRWDTDGNPLNGYQGEVKPQSGGAIVPHGGLKATNFINVAGNIGSSGGGTTPPPPYPQGPRFNDGQGALIAGGSDFSGGGFFTGYWLTTGEPDIIYPGTAGPNPVFFGQTGSLSNGIFVGGWYTLTTNFSMTSGTSGVYVSPNPATEQVNEPAIDIEKFVSVDGGITFEDADAAPGPILNLSQQANVQFRFIVTNIGNEALQNISVVDNVYGAIPLPQTTLNPGESLQADLVVAGTTGNHENIATVTGTGVNSGTVVTDNDAAHYVGTQQAISIDIEKLVSPDNGTTWFDADNPPGPIIVSPQNPQFQYVVTNTGTEPLIDVTITDNILGLIVVIGLLEPGETDVHIRTDGRCVTEGQNVNIATVVGTGQTSGIQVTDTDPAFWFCVEQVNPSIMIEKLVSVDNGVTFIPADTSPGPILPEGVTPRFKLVVTNTGTVPLQNFTVTDPAHGFVDTILLINPGDVLEFLVP